MIKTELSPLTKDVSKLKEAWDALGTLTQSGGRSVDENNGHATLELFTPSQLSTDDLNDVARIREEFLVDKVQGQCGVKNLSISVEENSVYVRSESGQSFASSRVGLAKIPSNNRPGEFFTATIKNGEFSISEAAVTGVLWHTTNNRKWDKDKLLYLWVINPDDTNENVMVFVSSYFKTDASTSPTGAAKYGSIGNLPTETGHEAFVALTDTLPVAIDNYEGKPMVCIGAFKATKSSSNAWTFKMDSDVGVEEFGHELWLDFAKGSGGADSNSFYVGAASAPKFQGGETAKYRVLANGQIQFGYLPSPSAINGSNNQDVQMGLPGKYSGPFSEFRIPLSRIRTSGSIRMNPRMHIDQGSSLAKFEQGMGNVIENDDFSNGQDTVCFLIQFQAL